MRWFVVALCLAAVGLGAWKAARSTESVPVPGDSTTTIIFRVVDDRGAGISHPRVADRCGDDIGTCELRVPSAKETGVRVSCDGYCPAQVRVGPLPSHSRLERWVRLERARMLNVKVLRATGEPASDARVRLELIGGPPDAESPRFAATDGGGRAAIDGVPDGYVQVTVVPPGYTSFPYRLQLVAGRAHDPITLEARRTTRVVVDIVDRQGGRVHDVHVSTSRAARVWSRPEMSQSDTFETDLVEECSCAIEVLDASLAFGSLKLVGDGRRERTERIVLTPMAERPDARAFQLRVIDSESEDSIPLAHVNLRLPWPEGTTTMSDALALPHMDTGMDGRLSLPAIPSGTVDAWVTHPQYLRGAGYQLSESPTAIAGIAALTRKRQARTVTCIPERPVRIVLIEPAAEQGADGVVEIHDFDQHAKEIDIRYRPDADISRECVLRAVPIGAHNIVLPLYPTGDLLLHCLDQEGRPIPRARVAVQGDDFAGAVWGEDPLGRLLIREVPVGEAAVWIHVWGRRDVGPLPCVIRQGERAQVEARLGPRLALLGVHLGFVDGGVPESLRVFVLDTVQETEVPLVSEQFWDPLEGEPVFETLSDGRLYLPLPAGEFVVAFQGHTGPRRDWGGPLFGFMNVRVPDAGVIDLSAKLEWSVCVSNADMNCAMFTAGGRLGDIVLSWDGRPVRDVQDCTPAEKPIAVTLRRKDRMLDISLPPGDYHAFLDRFYSVGDR